MPNNHESQPVFQAGAKLTEARAVMIAIHGRGGSAQDILGLADVISSEDVALFAPQANRSTWYPQSFLAPIETNEPGLSSALNVMDTLLTKLTKEDFPSDKIILMGFSQGACLATEFAARHAQRFGGVIGFSGGLIGPPGTSRDYVGAFDGTPVFLGCSDVDFHIPLERVKETTEVMGRMGATVDEKIGRESWRERVCTEV
ncbi:MAG: dienelactone hydrolase family protein [Chloroflexota bacterium]